MTSKYIINETVYKCFLPPGLAQISSLPILRSHPHLVEVSLLTVDILSNYLRLPLAVDAVMHKSLVRKHRTPNLGSASRAAQRQLVSNFLDRIS